MKSFFSFLLCALFALSASAQQKSYDSMSEDEFQQALLTMEHEQQYAEVLNAAKIAIKKKYGVGHYFMGRLYQEGHEVAKDEKKALGCYKSAAKCGYAMAYNAIGDCHRYGKGTKENSVEAENAYVMAAETGSCEYKFQLGDRYASGDGVKQDAGKAEEWFIKAAEQGGPKAQLALATRYICEQGVAKDVVKAKTWYEKAATGGDANIKFAYAQVLREGVFGNEDDKYLKYNIDDNDKKALKWYLQAAELGHKEAVKSVVDFYVNGRGGVKKNDPAGVKWYEMGAEDGNAICQYALGVCYETGEGKSQDVNKALELYNKSAEQGYEEAMCKLGECYIEGKGVDKDYNKAIELIQKAIDAGSPQASFLMGTCYHNGYGVKKNDKKALDLYYEAMEKSYFAYTKEPLDAIREIAGKVFDLTDSKPEPPVEEANKYLTQYGVALTVVDGESIDTKLIADLIVEKDGSITPKTFVKRVGRSYMEIRDHDMIETYLKPLRYMPKWKPANINGEPIRYNYKLCLRPYSEDDGFEEMVRNYRAEKAKKAAEEEKAVMQRAFTTALFIGGISALMGGFSGSSSSIANAVSSLVQSGIDASQQEEAEDDDDGIYTATIQLKSGGKICCTKLSLTQSYGFATSEHRSYSRNFGDMEPFTIQWHKSMGETIKLKNISAHENDNLLIPGKQWTIDDFSISNGDRLVIDLDVQGKEVK